MFCRLLAGIAGAAINVEIAASELTPQAFKFSKEAQINSVDDTVLGINEPNFSQQNFWIKWNNEDLLISGYMSQLLYNHRPL